MRLNKVRAASLAAFFITTSPVYAAAPVAEATSKAVDLSSSTANATASSATNRLRPDVRLESLERVSEARGKVVFALQQDVDMLTEQVAQLSGKLEEQAYQLEQVLQRQRELYQELERRLANQATLTAAQTGKAVKPAKSDERAAAEVTKPMQSGDKNADQAYDAAVKLVIEKKQYAEAIPAFRQFVANYPNSEFRPNAHYWLGQLLFSQGDKSAAAKEFEILMAKYPASSKRADAILKLGLIAQDTGDKEAAKQRFNQVLKEYEGSASAQLAKDYLTAQP